MAHGETDPETASRHERILGAVLELLAKDGISGVSMRAVAREAGVALGLVSYHYQDKKGLILAALRRVESQDVAMVQPASSLPPVARLRAALERVADPEFLKTDYLALRLQLWALAQADGDYEQINIVAQQRYRSGLAELIRAARPGLSRLECNRRATDIDVLQNGMWLTALLGLDRSSVRRIVARSKEIALG